MQTWLTIAYVVRTTLYDNNEQIVFSGFRTESERIDKKEKLPMNIHLTVENRTIGKVTFNAVVHVARSG